MYDLLLKDGRVVDPLQDLNKTMDIAVKDGNIAKLAQDIPADDAKKVKQVADKLVIPGLIDFHTHVYWGGNPISMNPDTLLRKCGVTTFVDAGSAGAGNFLGFKKHVIERSQARVFAFLNISYPGLFSGETSFGELCDMRLVDVAATFKTAKKFSKSVLGIKVRLSADAVENTGTMALHPAKHTATMLGKPMMIHIGTPPPTAEEILPYVSKGDIIAHPYRKIPNILLGEDGEILSEAVETLQNGAFLDLAHGRNNLSFAVAKQMLDQDVYPDLITSDINTESVEKGFYLPNVMSKLLNLGMGLDEVIKAVTTTPAKLIGREEDLGSLKQGTTGDITVLELQSGKVEFYDSIGEKLVGTKRFSPVFALKNGTLIK